MSDWQEIRLGDVLTLQRGFDLPARERAEGPFPIVSSAGVTGSHREFKVKPPGVVIGRYGSLGTVHWVSKPFWPLNTSLWVKDFKGNDPRFVAYLLKTVTVDGSTASAVPGVNRNHLHTRPVRRPSPAVQRRIAAVLSAFDELIAINERRIALLEDLARSLYREWFVQFRFPGHEEVKFVNSELGSIPEGWEVRRLGDVLRVDKGLSYKGAHLTGSGPSMANLKCFAPHGGFRRSGTKPYSGIYRERHSVVPGDLIVANTDLTQAGHVVGSPAILPRRGFSEGGLVSHHLFAVRALGGRKEVPFFFHLMLDARFREFARSRASGTTVLGFRSDDLIEYPYVAPPAPMQGQFSEFARLALEHAESLVDENEALAATRDLLVPRLVTGRLDISEVDLGDLLPADAA